MRSFASSDGGYDLLLTPKDKKNTNPAKSNKYELLHPNQFQIVAQRLKSPYFRKFSKITPDSNGLSGFVKVLNPIWTFLQLNISLYVWYIVDDDAQW